MTEGAAHPANDGWVVAIHRTEADFTPLGAGVLIDQGRVLTCAHLVPHDGVERESLWVAFPKSDQPDGGRMRVTDVAVPAEAGVADVAVLTLDGGAPSGVRAAPLRCPRPTDLIGRRWWAFGFPGGDVLGNAAQGLVGGALGYGWVRLDSDSRYLVEPGFSGSGLWSADYEAVVGIMGEANERGDGRAISLFQADRWLPTEKLARLAEWSIRGAGEVALAAWGWTLVDDPEAGRHWWPRARGVTLDSERGHRFRGRTAVLKRIVCWLDRQQPDRRALVVTGSPGVGKSAVLGRIVTTADPAGRTALPADDDGIKATEGSVACAVHAKGKTALEVAHEIARAASAALPERVDDLAPALRDVLAERHGLRFNVVIDALDEASDHQQTRAIVTRVVLPLVETCADTGVQIIVGTRRADAGGDLLRSFGGAVGLIDLDDPANAPLEDLRAYALVTLQLLGSERADNPYMDDAVALPVAARIAELAGRNFLVAGLVARAHGLHDTSAVDPASLSFTPSVDAALAAYLERIAPVGGVSATTVLTALAYAEAPGLTPELWQAAVEALDQGRVTATQLITFARTSAANFLVESSESHDVASYRLFHQALNDVLLADRARVFPTEHDERNLTHAFIAYGQQTGWASAPRYLLRSLPAHAANGGVTDELLLDDDYLLHADLRRLSTVLNSARSKPGQERTRLIRLTPYALDADPSVRAAQFSVTEQLEGLTDRPVQAGLRQPYHALWAVTEPRTELLVLEGHANGARAVCSVETRDRVLLASAGHDEMVRVWHPDSGDEAAVLSGHSGRVNCVHGFRLGNRALLVSGGNDTTVRVWDVETATLVHTLEGHNGWVMSVCSFVSDGRVLVASAGGMDDSTLRIWDPATGKQLWSRQAHESRINAVCALMLAGKVLLVTASDDGQVIFWDPRNGEPRYTHGGHEGWVSALCPLEVNGKTALVAGDHDGMVKFWDPLTGRATNATQLHSGGISALQMWSFSGRRYLACADPDADTVLVRPLDDGSQPQRLRGHVGGVNDLCVLPANGEDLLVTAGKDGTVRLWRPTGSPGSPRPGIGRVNDLCMFGPDDHKKLACVAEDGRRIVTFDSLNGTPGPWGAIENGRFRAVYPAGRHLDRFLTVDNDGNVQRWPTNFRSREIAPNGIRATCGIVQRRTTIALASMMGEIAIISTAKGTSQGTYSAHAVTAMTFFTYHGQMGLAVAADGGIRFALEESKDRWRLDASPRILCGDRIQAMCNAAGIDESTLLINAVDDSGKILLWPIGKYGTDEESAHHIRDLVGHTGRVNALYPFTLDSRSMLASASDDRTVRIWDLQTRTCLRTIPVHHPALTCAWHSGLLTVGVTAGVMAIKVDL